MQLIDTHCHLDVAEFAADREAVLAAARTAGVAVQVLPGVDAAGWPGLLALCRAEADLYPALGLHPLYLERHRDADLDALRALVGSEQAVAIGEIGLDFFHQGAERAAQEVLFEAQLAIAREAGLPVLLHVRKAHEEVLRILRSAGVRGGIAHAFNGSLQQAERYIELGFRLGFGGMLTYERSTRLRALVKALPIEAIVLETDAPDLPPESHRWQRNSPAYLPEVAVALAEVRGEDLAYIAERTTANAVELFGLTMPPE